MIVALFNLLPGAPLDGGRVFAAWRWRRHGSPVQAREEAAHAGVRVAHAMIAVGVVVVFIGAGSTGLWLALLGWFLAGAARAELSDVETRHVLDHLTVGEVMTPNPAMVPDTMTLDTLVGCVLPKIHGSTVPVVRDGRLVGLITPDHLRRVAPGEWRLRTTADIATPGRSSGYGTSRRTAARRLRSNWWRRTAHRRGRPFGTRTRHRSHHPDRSGADDPRRPTPRVAAGLNRLRMVEPGGSVVDCPLGLRAVHREDSGPGRSHDGIQTSVHSEVLHRPADVVSDGVSGELHTAGDLGDTAPVSQ